MKIFESLSPVQKEKIVKAHIEKLERDARGLEVEIGILKIKINKEEAKAGGGETKRKLEKELEGKEARLVEINELLSEASGIDNKEEHSTGKSEGDILAEEKDRLEREEKRNEEALRKLNEALLTKNKALAELKKKELLEKWMKMIQLLIDNDKKREDLAGEGVPEEYIRVYFKEKEITIDEALIAEGESIDIPELPPEEEADLEPVDTSADIKKLENKIKNLEINKVRSDVEHFYIEEEKDKEWKEIQAKAMMLGVDEMLTEVLDNDEWTPLTHGQKMLVLEQMSQGTLANIEEGAKERFAEKNKISFKAKDFNPIKLGQKIWRNLAKPYYINKEKKALAQEVQEGKAPFDVKRFNQLVKMNYEMDLDVKVIDGKAVMQFASVEEGASPEAKIAIEEFNKAANDYARMPDTWRNERAAKSTDEFSKKNHEKYLEAKNKYEEARSAMIAAKMEENKDLGSLRSVERSVLLGVKKIDYQIATLQNENTNPEASEEIKRILESSAYQALFKDSETIWRGLYMGLGAGARALTSSELGAATGPVIASIIGGWRARRKANEKINAAFKEGRKQKSFREMTADKRIAFRGGYILDPNGIEITDKDGKTIKVKYEELEVKNKDGSISKSRVPVRDQDKAMFGDKNADLGILGTAGKVMSGFDVNTKEVAGFIDADSQIQRLERLLGKLRADPSDLERNNIISELNGRVQFIEFKLDQGLVNYSEKNPSATGYQMLELLSEAAVECEIQKDNLDTSNIAEGFMTTQENYETSLREQKIKLPDGKEENKYTEEEIEEFLREPLEAFQRQEARRSLSGEEGGSLLNKIIEKGQGKLEEKQKKFVRNETLRGAAVGATFSILGRKIVENFIQAKHYSPDEVIKTTSGATETLGKNLGKVASNDSISIPKEGVKVADSNFVQNENGLANNQTNTPPISTPTEQEAPKIVETPKSNIPDKAEPQPAPSKPKVQAEDGTTKNTSNPNNKTAPKANDVKVDRTPKNIDTDNTKGTPKAPMDSEAKPIPKAPEDADVDVKDIPKENEIDESGLKKETPPLDNDVKPIPKEEGEIPKPDNKPLDTTSSSQENSGEARNTNLERQSEVASNAEKDVSQEVHSEGEIEEVETEEEPVDESSLKKTVETEESFDSGSRENVPEPTRINADLENREANLPTNNDPRNLEDMKGVRQTFGRSNILVTNKAPDDVKINQLDYKEWNNATDHLFEKKNIPLESYESYEKERTLQTLFGHATYSTEYEPSLDKNTFGTNVDYFREQPEWKIIEKIPARYFFDFNNVTEVSGNTLIDIPKANIEKLVKAGWLIPKTVEIDGILVNRFEFVNKEELIRMANTYQKFDALNSEPIGNENIEKYITRITKDLHQTRNGTLFILDRSAENDADNFVANRERFRNSNVQSGRIYPRRVYQGNPVIKRAANILTRGGMNNPSSWSTPVRNWTRR